LIALSIVGTLLVACGGGSSGSGTDSSTDIPPSDRLSIRASSLKFDKKTLVALPNRSVTVTFENDEGVLHNFAVYKDKSAKEKIYGGEIFNGKKTVDETFTAPAAGEYFFRCDVHPDTMTGTFLVQEPV
jgi:plastocyanin